MKCEICNCYDATIFSLGCTYVMCLCAPCTRQWIDYALTLPEALAVDLAQAALGRVQIQENFCALAGAQDALWAAKRDFTKIVKTWLERNKKDV